MDRQGSHVLEMFYFEAEYSGDTVSLPFSLFLWMKKQICNY